MQAKLLSKDGNRIKLLLEDATPAIANAIRRAILGEIPVLAIEDVIIYENSSPLFDEVLALRLGLIPIQAEPEDLDRLNLREECSCKGKGCALCTVRFTLKAEGPKVVYSHDLVSEDEKIKPVPGIPVLKLGENQKVELEAEAILGFGKDHAKWQPAVVGYKYYPLIEIKENCTACGDCIEACPRDILYFEEGKVEVRNIEACTMCRACRDACEDSAIAVRGDSSRFIFTVESQGVMEPEDIFKKACDVLAKKADELANLLQA